MTTRIDHRFFPAFRFPPRSFFGLDRATRSKTGGCASDFGFDLSLCANPAGEATSEDLGSSRSLFAKMPSPQRRSCLPSSLFFTVSNFGGVAVDVDV